MKFSFYLSFNAFAEYCMKINHHVSNNLDVFETPIIIDRQEPPTFPKNTEKYLKLLNEILYNFDIS